MNRERLEQLKKYHGKSTTPLAWHMEQLIDAILDEAPTITPPIYTPGVWYGWSGGECPVDGRTLVDMEFTNRHRTRGNAGAWAWAHTNEGDDIIAFRIVPNHETGARR